MANNAILVLGMHRSGTSATCGVLQRMGIDFGPKLMPAKEGVNEKGYYEHIEITELNDAVFDAIGYYWFDVRPLPRAWDSAPEVSKVRDAIINVLERDFSSAPLWGLKDPRLCRLLPLWRKIFPVVGTPVHFVHVLRNPVEVVGSLQTRDGLNETGAYIAWLHHVLEAEYHTRNFPRSWLFYDKLLQDWRSEIIRIGKDLGISWPHSLSQAEKDVEAFLDVRLRHRRDEQVPEDDFGSLAYELYRRVKQGETWAFDAIRLRFDKKLDELKGAFQYMNSMQASLEKLTHHNLFLTEEDKRKFAKLERLKHEQKELQQRIHELLQERDRGIKRGLLKIHALIRKILG